MFIIFVFVFGNNRSFSDIILGKINLNNFYKLLNINYHDQRTDKIYDREWNFIINFWLLIFLKKILRIIPEQHRDYNQLAPYVSYIDWIKKFRNLQIVYIFLIYLYTTVLHALGAFISSK